jgi:hypothetical protein
VLGDIELQGSVDHNITVPFLLVDYHVEILPFNMPKFMPHNVPPGRYL